MLFHDRTHAGKQLAKKLSGYAQKNAVVYALPRGGVVIGYEVAQALHLPLDIIVTRKIGHPSEPEYAICAVAEDGDMMCNEAERTAVDPEWLEKAVAKERQEAKRRRETYQAGRPPYPATDKIAIIIDDGVATGLTMQLAIAEIKHQEPARLVVAIPVAPRDVAADIEKNVDELVMLDWPLSYAGAVGSYYEVFPQVEDAEVIDLMTKVRAENIKNKGMELNA